MMIFTHLNGKISFSPGMNFSTSLGSNPSFRIKSFLCIHHKHSNRMSTFVWVSLFPFLRLSKIVRALSAFSSFEAGKHNESMAFLQYILSAKEYYDFQVKKKFICFLIFTQNIICGYTDKTSMSFKSSGYYFRVEYTPLNPTFV